MTVPYDWLVLTLLATVCFFVLAWAVFVKIELTLPVGVMVIQRTDDRIVVSPVTARVTDVLVDVGTQVAEGDALVRVVVPELHRRLAEAEQRERIIREEMRLTNSNDAELSRMLIESRVESAALTTAIQSDEVIVSPYSGEIVEIQVSAGQVAMTGQEVISVRVGESVDIFAIAFVPHASNERVLSNAEVVLRCPGAYGVEMLSARAISDPPRNLIQSNLAPDTDFDLSNHQLPLMHTEPTTIGNGTRCEGRIPLNAQTPSGILLGATRSSQ